MDVLISKFIFCMKLFQSTVQPFNHLNTQISSPSIPPSFLRSDTIPVLKTIIVSAVSTVSRHSIMWVVLSFIPEIQSRSRRVAVGHTPDVILVTVSVRSLCLIFHFLWVDPIDNQSDVVVVISGEKEPLGHWGDQRYGRRATGLSSFQCGDQTIYIQKECVTKYTDASRTWNRKIKNRQSSKLWCRQLIYHSLSRVWSGSSRGKSEVQSTVGEDGENNDQKQKVKA